MVELKYYLTEVMAIEIFLKSLRRFKHLRKSGSEKLVSLSSILSGCVGMA
jgi:hypothetical protein